MQAEGGVIQFPDRVPAPADFSTFFAEEHRKVFKALYFDIPVVMIDYLYACITHQERVLEAQEQAVA